jgi:uncharacterized protein VirK/YbjX
MNRDGFGAVFFDLRTGGGEDFIKGKSGVGQHFPAHPVFFDTNHGVTLGRERGLCQTVERSGRILISGQCAGWFHRFTSPPEVVRLVTVTDNDAKGTKAGSLGPLGLPKALIATAPRLYPEPGTKRVKDKVKYVLRGLATPRLTREWFQLLHQPGLGALVQSNPRMLSKLQRPYLHRGLRPSQRLQVLKEHYAFVREKISADVLPKIYSLSGVPLARISLGEIGEFTLRLCYQDRFEKEGELTVALAGASTQEFIFAMSFTVWTFGQEPPEIFIGGLQGFKQSTKMDEVVAITRAMYGLRPKALLLFAVQQLATLWDIHRIRAVSNERSVFSDFRLKHKNVVSSYDEFWRDSQGELGADGLFTLPATFVPRDIAEIKPNKRTLYKRRYAMLEEIGGQIRQNTLRLSKASSAEPVTAH